MTRNGAILVVAAGLIVTSAGTAPSRPWPPPLVESTAVLTPEVPAALQWLSAPPRPRRPHARHRRASLTQRDPPRCASACRPWAAPRAPAARTRPRWRAVEA